MERQGLVYFVRMQNEEGLIKIGFSASIEARLRYLENQNRVWVEVLGVMDGTKQDESRVQDKFEQYCTVYKNGYKSEWFTPAPSLMAFISANTRHYERKFARRRKAYIGDMPRPVVPRPLMDASAHVATPMPNQKELIEALIEDNRRLERNYKFIVERNKHLAAVNNELRDQLRFVQLPLDLPPAAHSETEIA